MSQIIFKNEGHQETIQLDKDVFSMGRSADNQIVIRSEKISRRHCEIRKSGDGFIAVDLDSRNGTFVNGEKIKEKALKIGDVINVGDAVIIFEQELPPAPAVTDGARPADKDEFVVAVPQSNKGIISVVVGLVAVVALLYWYSQRISQKDDRAQNFIGNNSFESVFGSASEPSGWMVPDEIKNYVRVTNAEKQSGEKALVIESHAGADKKDIYNTVSSEKAVRLIARNESGVYTFGGWVKSEPFNKSLAGYKLAWFKAGESVPVAESCTELVYSPGQWKYLGASSVPPVFADYGYLSCVAIARNAKTYFDNITLNKATGQLPPPVRYEVGAQDLDISLQPGGIWRLQYKDTPILMQGEITIDSENISSRQSFGGTANITSYEAGNHIAFEGRLLHPDTLEGVKIFTEITALPNPAITYNLTEAKNTLKPQIVALSFQVPRERARNGMRLITATSIIEKSYFEEIKENGIIEVNMEMPDRMVIIKYSQPVQFQVIRRAETLEFVQVLSGDITALKIEFSQKPLLSDSMAAIEDAVKKAEEAVRQNMPGRAIEIYGDILHQVDKKHEIYQKISAVLDNLKNQADKAIAEVEEMVTFAQIMNDNKLYNEATQRAKQTAKTYKNTEYEKVLQGFVEQIDMGTKEQTHMVSEVNARKVLTMADNYLKSNQKEIAIWLYVTVIERYPNTTEAEDARRQTAEIRNNK
jgi:hypothetical protein